MDVVTVRELAVLAGTLANQGTDPTTRKVKLESSSELLECMLSEDIYPYPIINILLDEDGVKVSAKTAAVTSGSVWSMMCVLEGLAGIAIVFSETSPEAKSSPPPKNLQISPSKILSDACMDIANQLVGSISPAGSTNLQSNGWRSNDLRALRDREAIVALTVNCSLIQIAGRMNALGIENVMAHYRKKFADVSRVVVLDFTSTVTYDEGGIQILKSLNAKLRQTGRLLILRVPEDTIRREDLFRAVDKSCVLSDLQDLEVRLEELGVGTARESRNIARLFFDLELLEYSD